MIMEFLMGTGQTISPAQLDAALLGSDSFVREFRRSNGETTDAPWDWPKSERDEEIFNELQEQFMSRLMG